MNKLVINLECLTAEEKCIVEKIAKKTEKRSALSLFWMPKCGDEYYCVSSYGGVAKCVWGDYITDKIRHSLNNVFRTQKEAEFELERLKVLAELRRLAGKDKLENGIDDFKMYGLCCINMNELIVCTFFVKDITGTPHRYLFSTEESAKNAIEEIGKERLKKYLFKA